MRDEQYTRRRLLKWGGTAGTGAMVGLAGCGGNTEGGTTTDGGDGNGNGNGNGMGGTTTAGGTTTTTSGGTDTAELSLVPADATVVGRVDVRTLLDGPIVRGGVERTLGMIAEQDPEYSGPTSYEAVLSTARETSGLDPRGLRTVTTFWAGPAGTTSGAVMRTDWATADLVDALETMGTTLSERSYGGTTLYVADEGQTALADLGDGQFALGSEGAIRRVVDVDNGEAAPVEGTVVSAFERAPAGPMRFGADLTDQPVPEDNPLSSVRTVWGGIGADGDQRQFLVAMDAGDASAAGELSTLIETSLQRARTQFEEEPQFSEEFGDVVDMVSAVEVNQDGSTVTISYAASASESGAVGTLLAAVVASFVLGLGSRPPRIPQASFAFEYDADAGSVTITHQAGDHIEAGNLYVVVDSREETWAARSSELGPAEMVKAGNRVTVEMAADATVRIVYRGEDGSGVLARFSGPDA
jgi:hypothetical protein